MRLYRKTFSKEYRRELKESGIKDNDIRLINKLRRQRRYPDMDEHQDAIVHGAATGDYEPYARSTQKRIANAGAIIGAGHGVTSGIVNSVARSKGKTLPARVVSAAGDAMVSGLVNGSIGAVAGSLVGHGVGHTRAEGMKAGRKLVGNQVEKKADQIRVARGDMSASDYADKYGRRQ